MQWANATVTKLNSAKSRQDRILTCLSYDCAIGSAYQARGQQEIYIILNHESKKAPSPLWYGRDEISWRKTTSTDRVDFHVR